MFRLLLKIIDIVYLSAGMKVEYCKYQLRTTHPFGTAHGIRSATSAVFVRIHAFEEIGYGEASMPPYYPETQDSVIDFINEVNLSQFTDSKDLHKVIQHLHGFENNFAAKNALDTALHDAYAKSKKKSLQEYLTTDISDLCSYTCFTIGLDDKETMLSKCEEAKDFPCLKIKLDGKSDVEIIQSIRAISDQELMVDANQSWNDVDVAILKSKQLHQLGVTLIEQPFAKGALEKTKALSTASEIPIFADEDMQGLNDLSKIAEAYDGINLKLMKCGGISKAMEIIDKARQLNLKIMIGCMTESSCGISASCQLADLCDYLDLDGNLLLSNDPYRSTAAEDGCILVDPNSYGIGVIDVSDLWGDQL